MNKAILSLLISILLDVDKVEIKGILRYNIKMYKGNQMVFDGEFTKKELKAEIEKKFKTIRSLIYGE